MPLLTIIHMIIDLALHLFVALNPLWALVGSVPFTVGWAVQVGFWTQCDIASALEVNGGLG